MHIVHLIAPELSAGNKANDPLKVSQFGAGVLGFLFKVEPEKYFQKMEIEHP